MIHPVITLLTALLAFLLTPSLFAADPTEILKQVDIFRNPLDSFVIDVKVRLTDLRDGSSLVRRGLYWKIHPNWSLFWLHSRLLGGASTEFGHLQVSRLSDFGVRYHI